MADQARARAAGLALWRGRVDPAPIGGGITNHNFLVEDGGRRYVVRIGGDIPVHGIARANELAASRAAHAAGIAPAIVHAEPGALVLDHIDGRTFAPEDVRDPVNAGRLATLLRRCHREIPKHLRGPAIMFWVFHTVRDYAHTLETGGSPYRPDLPAMLAAAQTLERAVGAVEIVFGHNDLLAANILDDGARLWLVDWEYSGFNSPLFDLGGLASNSEASDAVRERIVEAYFERPPDDGLRRRLAAMTAASLLRETMWSMVSEIHSNLDFDYRAYTALNRARFEAALTAFKDTERA